MAKAKKRVAGKAGGKKSATRAAGRKPAGPRRGEHDALVRRISEALGISVADAMLRALRELAERVADEARAIHPRVVAAADQEGLEVAPPE